MGNILHFGTKFDGNPHHKIGQSQFVGEKKLLQLLEIHLGLSGYPSNTEYLRIELFRQSLLEYLQSEPQAFFQRSFEADRFATATALLDWRDELLLAGWDFEEKPDLPTRLRSLGGVEKIFKKKIEKPPQSVEAFGFADRFVQVLEKLENRDLPFKKLVLYEPLDLLSPQIQRLVKIFEEKNTQVEAAEPLMPLPEISNLTHLQRRLAGQTTEKKQAMDDGSLLILKAKRDSDAATFLAQLLRTNPDLRPVFLVPEMSLTLEQAIIREGFPAMGILSASLARPSLQALKLAPVFLWEPVDVFKMLEFATLPVKPLEEGLAAKVAEALSAKPGLFNDTWFAMIFGYLEDENTPEEARKNYDFWFDRRRRRSDSTTPKREVIGIYQHLHEWAKEYFEKNGSKMPSLLVLAEQARRIRDLLVAIPEQRLTFLELERIVRTIYEPAPVQFAPPEKRRFDFCHSPGAFAAPADVIFWWNCIHNEPAPTALRWQPQELHFFENQKIPFQTTRQQNDLRLLLRNRAVLAARQKLVLVVPENVDGATVEPHLLLGDIEAAFDSTRAFTFDIESAGDRRRLASFFQLPPQAFIESRTGHRVPPQLQIHRPEAVEPSDYETLTHLESLFYYPHKWFFNKKLRLSPKSILSVTGDATLTGNLAHRFFEFMLKEDFSKWEKKDVLAWIDEKAPTLLEREGATLLMYGREPERNRFLNRLKNAAWTLISLLRKNNWQVVATEMTLEGTFCDLPVRGKADLVLQRGEEQAILDLKWSGAGKRRLLIKNGADLQLVFYSKLLPPESRWAHTGYFILENSELIARNNLAFAEAKVAGAGEDHQSANELIFNKMEKTFRWRAEQIRAGRVEIRTAANSSFLEELYAESLLDLLELPAESSKYDDFRSLIE